MKVEVISGVERRRRWSEDQKRAIVAEAFAPGASVSDVARRADVVTGQIYRWRGELQSLDDEGFARVAIAAPTKNEGMSGLAAVEIDFGKDIRVRILPTAPKDLTATVIRALVTR